MIEFLLAEDAQNVPRLQFCSNNAQLEETDRSGCTAAFDLSDKAGLKVLFAT